MQNVLLGNTSEPVSKLALGCMGLGTLTDDEASFALLDRYAEDGGQFLDTADCYAWWWHDSRTGGQSEEVIGRWLARTGRRDQTFVATKGTGRVVNAEVAMPAGAEQADWSKAEFVGAGAQTLRTSLEGSLRRLGVEHIDLYYVHVDDRSTALEETLETLAGFVQEGKVRHLAGRTCTPGGWSGSGDCARPTAGRSRSPCSNSTPTCAAVPGWTPLDRGRRTTRLPARAQ